MNHRKPHLCGRSWTTICVAAPRARRCRKNRSPANIPHLQPALELALRGRGSWRRRGGRPKNRATKASLCVVCPHCRNKFDTPSDAALHTILCSHCGQTFSLTGSDADENTFAAGHVIGHFELLAKLGEGGFGTVWTARDTHLDRLVAVKMPRRGLLTPRDADLFFREARAAAQLRHPNIAAVHEVGREGETVYIVSELVHGVSLADWARRPAARRSRRRADAQRSPERCTMPIRPA